VDHRPGSGTSHSVALSFIYDIRAVPQGEVASPEAMTEGVPRTARLPPNRHRDKGFLSPGRTPLPFARQASLRYSPLMGENRKHPRLRRVREVAGVADWAAIIGAIWGRCGPAGKEVEEEVPIGMPVAYGLRDGYTRGCH